MQWGMWVLEKLCKEPMNENLKYRNVPIGRAHSEIVTPHLEDLIQKPNGYFI